MQLSGLAFYRPLLLHPHASRALRDPTPASRHYPSLYIGLTALTLTATSIAITEHHAAQAETAQIRSLEHDAAQWKRDAASRDNHARTLQNQLDVMKVDLDAKTSLLRVLTSHKE